MSFETLFVDESPDVINALAATFGRNWPDSVRFAVGNIFRGGPGAFVTPTNSEGDMSAGLDLQLRTLFPEINLQDRLQEHVHSLPAKRLRLGATVWIETGDAQNPVVIFAPTFRTRWDLATPNRVYRAALAVFRSVQAQNANGETPIVSRILMPGFGTGVGGVDPTVAARKMFQAYRHARATPVDENALPCVLKPRHRLNNIAAPNSFTPKTPS